MHFPRTGSFPSFGRACAERTLPQLISASVRRNLCHPFLLTCLFCPFLIQRTSNTHRPRPLQLFSIYLDPAHAIQISPDKPALALWRRRRTHRSSVFHSTVFFWNPYTQSKGLAFPAILHASPAHPNAHGLAFPSSADSVSPCPSTAPKGPVSRRPPISLFSGTRASKQIVQLFFSISSLSSLIPVRRPPCHMTSSPSHRQLALPIPRWTPTRLPIPSMHSTVAPGCLGSSPALNPLLVLCFAPSPFLTQVRLVPRTFLASSLSTSAATHRQMMDCSVLGLHGIPMRFASVHKTILGIPSFLLTSADSLMQHNYTRISTLIMMLALPSWERPLRYRD
ncbi:hypothetical protein EW146_g4242 [Bondarzewia mesenterica]|uniref:Uncharacterized protein n=1 Tax=Bondarzewia mesenterica TaxID=1095465 RepID=A0A4S4LVB9_9AGAM|nr:hypothetical protein EW146_g4242 [Bondarzewia mesenterica]